MLEALGKKLKDYNIQVSAFNCAQDNEHGDLSEYLDVDSYPTQCIKICIIINLLNLMGKEI